MVVVGATLFGMIVGSFLNVVVQRVPAGGSVVWPASHCPRCGKAILHRDKLPIVSYVLLRGSCRGCGKQIPVRYPVVEGLTGVLFGCAALRFEGVGPLLLALALISVCVALAVTDLEHRLLPNAIMVPAGVSGFVLSVAAAQAAWWTYPLAAFAVAGFLMVLAAAYPGGMGMGDVKMGGMLGLFLGPYAALAIFVGALCGTVVYAALAPFGWLGRQSALPFGTFMALGGVVTLFVGPELCALYLNFVATS